MAENAPPCHSPNKTSPGPRPLQLASSSVLSSPSNSPSRSSALHNSISDSPPGPPPFSTIKNGRQQSSISYLPSNRDKNKSTSLLPSPLSPTGFSRGLALRNGDSTGAGSEIEQGPRALGATRTVTLDLKLKGRPPATLAEKHADLLHFIAQKESKCLELRSQLATHEAELLQLKRKWERIINRGFDKPSSNSFPSPITPSTASLLTTNTAGSPSGVVLEGIKEGVQGMGRFITAGLESIGQGNPPLSPLSGTLPPTSRKNRRVSSKFPVPLRLGSGNNYGHESHSSSSTSASVSTIASSSTSATSPMLEHGTTQVLSPPLTSTSETSNEYDEFGDFKGAPSRSLNDLTEQEENPEQVLMVHDTGATPTMSPNPHFQRRSRMDVKKNDPAYELDSGWDNGRTTSGALTTSADDSVDDLMNFGSQPHRSSSSPATHTIQPFPTKPPKLQRTSLPGVSSIPGLASSSMPINGTTPQSMSTWVGSVGKKWDEIRESQTFTKSQKRASILLSDVSQSIVSALISPSSLSTSSRPGTASKSGVEKKLFTTNAPSSSLDESTIKMNEMEIPISTSLLDDSEVDEALKLGSGSPLLVPAQASKKEHLNPSTKLKVEVGLGMNNVPSSNSIDEDWNW